MANQIIVTQSGNVQVSIEPPANVQVQISRAAIGTVSNVPTANFANYAANVTSSSQPNITSLGTLSNLSVSGNSTVNNLTVTGNLSVGNLVANSANYANFAGVANTANSVTLANVSGAGNIASINLDGNVANLLTGNGTFVAIPIGGGNTDNISNGTSNVSIPVANGNVQVYANNQHWTFTDVGNLLLAGGNSVVQSIANSSLDILNPNVSTMVLTPDQGYTSQALVLDPTFNGHIHLRAPGANIDQPVANLYLGGEASSFEVGQFNGAVPNLFIHSNNNTWMFDITGNLTLPGNVFAVNYANGTQVPLDGPVANANYANFAGTAYSVDGANVSGEVANANYSSYANIAASANSVALANVSGIGNIANINLDGNASNILFGNGTFSAIPVVSNVANANYANFAGTAYSVAGANVSGEVANANYASYANIANTANTANTANSVALANVSGIGNIANINLDGSSSNVLFGNGVFAPESTSIANANYANFAGTLINGNSNVSIPSANGNINVTTAGSANTIIFQTNGAIRSTPPSTGFSSIFIDSVGNPVGDAHRISSQRSRGTIAIPLSVQNNDYTMSLITWAYNGSAYTSSFPALIRARVDSAYTANSANVPIGWRITTNDATNTSKTHDFWANGNVSFANSVFVTDSLSVTGNITGGNITGNLSILANGTSNISIPSANGNIVFSTAGIANVVNIQTNGQMNLMPSTSAINGIVINSIGTPIANDTSRISSFRYRGTMASPLTVQPGDTTMRFLTAGHNGSALQTNSIASIRAVVDSSYTANGANIPIGWQMQVNDTNSGTNNQTKTHFFYANGAVAISGNLSANGGNYSFSNGSSGATALDIFGDKTTNSAFSVNDAQFSVTMSNVNTTTGFSPFRFQQYAPTSNQFGPMYFFRARGNSFANQASVVANDQVMSLNFLVNSNNATSSIGQFNATVASNDNAGNVGMTLDFNATGTGTTGYLNGRINLLANITDANNFQANNVTVNNGSNNFMKLSSYTAANLTAITGQIGWMAAVTNSAQGSNPNGMIAFWDTTNSRWSYIHDNTAV
jgi:hypothetical protein